jgi:hypothetical protein
MHNIPRDSPPCQETQWFTVPESYPEGIGFYCFLFELSGHEQVIYDKDKGLALFFCE